MKTKGIIIGTLGVAIVGCIAWGIKSLMDMVNDEYESDYGGCDFVEDDE